MVTDRFAHLMPSCRKRGALTLAGRLLGASVLALMLAGQGAMAAPARPVAAKAGHAAPRASAPVATPAPKGPPKLLVAIAVDQFSADLFAQYRTRYTAGLARLQQGAVFASGFQSHAATETCPGHSTILTGVHPARTGIIANNWYDMTQARADKRVYCAENEKDADSTSGAPVVSAVHLKVPTLGEYMKQQWPQSRNVAVSVKDRAVMMMGGHQTDAAFWSVGQGFSSYNGTTLPDGVLDENAKILALLNKGAPAMVAPVWCGARARPIKAGELTVGTGRFAIDPNDFNHKLADQFKYSPRADAATLDLAARLVADMKLGKGAAPDMLSVSLSATDYIGHAYGTEGEEMCIQMDQLDRSLGAFFARLDAMGLDYAVVLTADHGGIDLPERLREQGVPEADRGRLALSAPALGAAIAADLKLTEPLPPCAPGGQDSPANLICAEGLFGDYWVSPALPKDTREKVIAALAERLRANPQVAMVFTHAQIAALPVPQGHPQDWTIPQRIRASFDAERSGDVFTVLKRAIVPVPTPGADATTVTTHGSPWDYDRRVPILFWRRGMAGQEQPQPVETVDIAPTLAALVGLKTQPGQFDGRCLDIDGGPADSCRAGQ
ncbi:MAG TPA: alkaline phosphatase family protein [Novosphingobium sp.]|nr:alkaline phosphatase family protein [Novosphingobium sp.]